MNIRDPLYGEMNPIAAQIAAQLASLEKRSNSASPKSEPGCEGMIAACWILIFSTCSVSVIPYLGVVVGVPLGIISMVISLILGGMMIGKKESLQGALLIGVAIIVIPLTVAALITLSKLAVSVLTPGL